MQSDFTAIIIVAAIAVAATAVGYASHSVAVAGQ